MFLRCVCVCVPPCVCVALGLLPCEQRLTSLAALRSFVPVLCCHTYVRKPRRTWCPLSYRTWAARGRACASQGVASSACCTVLVSERDRSAARPKESVTVPRCVWLCFRACVVLESVTTLRSVVSSHIFVLFWIALPRCVWSCFRAVIV